MDDITQVRGRVFNIQSYSIHDGPGVRTTVFLCGCPLRCRWCQNPESWTVEPKLFFLSEKCTGCGLCASVCPSKAVSIANGKAVTDRSKCSGCGPCVSACPNEARELSGMERSAGEILDIIRRDRIFIEGSGGGVTLSGGEVLFQADFAKSLLRLCKEDGFHTAIETCGHGPWSSFSEVLNYTDLVLYDFKHMDSATHREGTGVGNELILENARRVYAQAKKPLIARVPVIPGYNDSAENINKLADFILNELGADVKVHLLPYHRLGESKNDRLENYEGRFSAQPPSDEKMQELRAMLEGRGLTVNIVG